MPSMRRLAVRVLQWSTLACALASCASADLESRIEAAYRDVPRLDNELSASIIRTESKTFTVSSSFFKGDKITAAKESQARLSSSKGDVSFELIARTREPEVLQAFDDPALQAWMDAAVQGLAAGKSSVFGDGASPLRLTLTIAPGKSAIADIVATELPKGGPAALSFTAPAGWIRSDLRRRLFAEILAHEAHHVYANLQAEPDDDPGPNLVRGRGLKEAVARAFAACSMGRAFGFGSLFVSTPMIPISPEGVSDPQAERLGAAPDVGLRFLAQADDEALNGRVSTEETDPHTDALMRTQGLGAVLFTTWWSSHFGPAYFVDFSGAQLAALDGACGANHLQSGEHFRRALLELASDGIDAQPFAPLDAPQSIESWEKLKAALAAWRADHESPAGRDKVETQPTAK